MTWSSVKGAIRSAVAYALKLPDYTGANGVVNGSHRVEWINKQESVRFDDSGSAWANLRMSDVRAEGTDEIRYTLVEGDTNDTTYYRPTYVGQRTFTVTVYVGSNSQEDDADSPGELGSYLRTRIRRNEALDILSAGGVALVSIGPTMEADYRDAHFGMVSQSITELKFRCVEQDEDTDGYGDFIAEVSGSVGTLDNNGEDIVTDADIVAPITDGVIVVNGNEIIINNDTEVVL